jgi:L-asparaginase
MDALPKLAGHVRPRLIIHGGAGNLQKEIFSPQEREQYRKSLRFILNSAYVLLSRGADALEVATHAVTLLEDDPLFNASKGAVFTRDGKNELEASVMVSRGKRKRGCGLMLLKHVKHPILLAREILLRGDDEDGQGGGATTHVQLSGSEAEALAERYGLEMVDPAYFWTEKRWKEHIKGLERAATGSGSAHWDAREYVPQGTTGAVVMDQRGTLCVATSTGGMTNKLPGRIGDSPTFGAGFWAEEWQTSVPPSLQDAEVQKAPDVLPPAIAQLLDDCLPGFAFSAYQPLPDNGKASPTVTRAAAVGGTGSGDTFLRLCACHAVAAIARFSSHPARTLQSALTQMAGPGGELQVAAGNRWGRTGEGEAGMVGIEVGPTGEGVIAADFNCGGMFRAWIDDAGDERVMIFRDE